MAERRTLVLIVHNDQAVRDALQFALRLEGLCVHVHNGGAALLTDPDLNRAGCVVFDEQMSQMDGYALFQRLHTKYSGIQAIMLTSNATAKVHARALNAGIRKVLEKPLMDNALMDNIRIILQPRCQKPEPLHNV